MLQTVRHQFVRIYLPLIGIVGIAGATAGVALRGGTTASIEPFHTDSLPPAPLVGEGGAAGFVGSKACAECHPVEAEQHARSLHSQTVAAAGEAHLLEHFRTAQVLEDRAIRSRYSFEVRGNTPVAKVERGGKTTELVPAFGIGSGKYGTTFVYERDGQYMESRASFFPPLKKWTWTPGQEDQRISTQPEGRILSRDEAIRCFLCHGTVIVQTDDQPVSPQSMFNVGCERCHGPGREHVQAIKSGKGAGGLYTFTKASGTTIMQLCSECHRRPTNSTALNLETDFNLPRFAGTALAASKCYTESKGRLSCSTCHNPHEPVSKDTAAYERACLSCHSPGTQDQEPCPVNSKSGCISCHMPLQPIGFPGTKLHNHWIKPYAKQAAKAFASPKTRKKLSPRAAARPEQAGASRS